MNVGTEPGRGMERESERGFLFERAPPVAAAIAFFTGAVIVAVIAAPQLPRIVGLDALHRLIAEFPEFAASVTGVTLMLLATGLRRRVDAAWAATCALLAAVSLYALLRHEHIAAAAAAGLAALALAAMRPAFFRHARLVSLAPSRAVALSVAAMLMLGVLGATLWAGERPGFAEAPWWALIADPHLGRPGRALLAGTATLLGLVLAPLLVQRMRRAPPPPADHDIARAEALMAQAEQMRPDAHLAFSGDKSFCFVSDAFVMTARGGGSLIAMGAPVGARAAWRPALSELRRQAEELALRPVVYAAPPELLPELIDCGFRVEKIGENALVDLARFSLAGGARQNLRTARRRLAEKEHAQFEVREPPHDPALWPELEAVSSSWLAGHGGTEKSFSLGRFDPAYLARHPIALVRINGRVIAFANLWTTPDKSHAALDLMRHDPNGAPHAVMDFLFTEILLWAQREGYRDFDLGMAPLAGLAEAQYAPLFARVGRLVYEHAEPLYGFKGLRKFKEKFGPRWEPRYLAAPGAWTMPIVLAEVALLTSGGVAAMLRKG